MLYESQDQIATPKQMYDDDPEEDIYDALDLDEFNEVPSEYQVPDEQQRFSKQFMDEDYSLDQQN